MQKDMKSGAPSTAGRIAYFLAPAITMVIGIPLAGLPFAGDPRGFFAPYTLIALPWWLGLLAAPGYIVATTREPTEVRASGRTLRWVVGSLVLGVVCSLASVAGGLLMPLFLPSGIATLVCCAILLRKLVPRRSTVRHVPPGSGAR